MTETTTGEYPDAMPELPPHVVAYYSALGARRSWPQEVLDSILGAAALFRDLTASDGRRWFTGELDGTRWWWECADDDGALVVVRQVEKSPQGTHAYDWTRLEDDAGFLPEHPLDPTAEPVEETTEDEFTAQWAAKPW